MMWFLFLVGLALENARRELRARLFPTPVVAPSSPAPSAEPDPDLVRQAREALVLAQACEALRCPRCATRPELPARAALCFHGMADAFLAPPTPARSARMLALAEELSQLTDGRRRRCTRCGAPLRVHFDAGDAVAITTEETAGGLGSYQGRPS